MGGLIVFGGLELQVQFLRQASVSPPKRHVARRGFLALVVHNAAQSMHLRHFRTSANAMGVHDVSDELDGADWMSGAALLLIWKAAWKSCCLPTELQSVWVRSCRYGLEALGGATCLSFRAKPRQGW